MTIDEEYQIITSAEVGEIVWDDLIRQNITILCKERDESENLGYWVSSEWAGGGRFPWEISLPRDQNP